MASSTSQFTDRHNNINDDLTGLVDLEDSEIVTTFSKTTVLITGGTGFLGQLLIEKLLRCVPDLKKIYVLGRPRRGKDMHTRFEDQFKDVFYDRLRQINPDFGQKVEPLAGECMELGLGLSNYDRSTIIDQVNVIFHCAATVRFDEPLKVAVAINTRGTREMLHLARACKDLKVLLHVSTAYSNCNLPEIKEQFYEVNLPGDKLIDLAESTDEDTLKRMTPALIHGHPNTYTYTKRAAEDVILKYGQGLPIAIVRPSIVVATRKEPLPGWSGNIYGLVGAMIAFAQGLLHVLHMRKEKIVDAVPGDMVSNTCIAAASKAARISHKNVAVEPPIYMCGTSAVNPISWEYIINTSSRHYEDYPSTHAIYVHFEFFVTTFWLFKAMSFIFHWIPAYFLDALAVLVGRKPILKKIYTKAEQLMGALDFFMNNEWKFSNTNTDSLYKSLSEVDRELFDFDFESIDWDSFCRDYVIGSRVYIMKEPLDNLKAGARKNTYIKVLHYFICSVLTVILYGLARFIYVLFI